MSHLLNTVSFLYAQAGEVKQKIVKRYSIENAIISNVPIISEPDYMLSDFFQCVTFRGLKQENTFDSEIQV